MTVRDIRTSIPITVCHVCGRTLLLGETPQVFVAGGARRSVCELCTSRAEHEGWVREGAEVPPEPSQVSERRRSLFGLLRSRPDPVARVQREVQHVAVEDHEPGAAPPQQGEAAVAPAQRNREAGAAPAQQDEAAVAAAQQNREAGAAPAAQPATAPRRRSWLDRLRVRDDPERRRRREFFPGVDDEPDPPATARPFWRSWSAAESADDPPEAQPQSPTQTSPTSAEQRMAAAVQAFNRSEHRRTLAGVGRSLGMPMVSVRPVDEGSALVTLVTAWELCWYRYEIDLSTETATVRVASQGWELHDLAEVERHPNAVADETGAVTLVALPSTLRP